MMTVWYMMTLLVISATIQKVSPAKLKEYDYELLSNEVPVLLPASSDDVEDLRDIDSMFDGNQETSDELLKEANALIDTKYRTWKRNVDLINSLLALPKHMNDAGRRR